VERALAILQPIAQGYPEDAETHRFLSMSLGLRGRVHLSRGNHRQARTSWEQAEAAIEPFSRRSRDPLLLVPWVQALLSLGHLERVRPVVERLRALGYRGTEYVELCRSKGLLQQATPTNNP